MYLLSINFLGIQLQNQDFQAACNFCYCTMKIHDYLLQARRTNLQTLADTINQDIIPTCNCIKQCQITINSKN